ncbi:MAG: ATP-binding cassette domain-containing protein [bacterium]|nr:ATP-binding cassette domain-containing protein [bacterium]
MQQQLATLSGGELRRVALARILIDEPEFLILDEPTNHLDLQMIEWLENYLKSQVSTLFMITHDRYFLESVCNQIYELDRGKLYCYPGNYSYFLEKQAERRENEAIVTEKMRQLLKRELAWMRKAPRARGTKQRYREQEFYKLEERYDAQKEVLSAEAGVLDLPVQERRLGTKVLKIKNLSKRF